MISLLDVLPTPFTSSCGKYLAKKKKGQKLLILQHLGFRITHGALFPGISLKPEAPAVILLSRPCSSVLESRTVADNCASWQVKTKPSQEVAGLHSSPVAALAGSGAPDQMLYISDPQFLDL